MPSRTEILEQANAVVKGEREDTYGGPEDSFRLIAGLWAMYLSRGGDTIRISSEDVAAMMALLKIARLSQAPDHLDSWIDLAGYAACGGEIGSRSKPQKPTDEDLLVRTY